MLQAIRRRRDHRQHHQGRDQQDPDDAHRERDGQRGEHGDDDVQGADRHAGDTCALLVEDDPGERAVEQARSSPARPRRARRRAARSVRVTVRIEPNRNANRFTSSAPASEIRTTPSASPV